MTAAEDKVLLLGGYNKYIAEMPPNIFIPINVTFFCTSHHLVPEKSNFNKKILFHRKDKSPIFCLDKKPM